MKVPLSEISESIDYGITASSSREPVGPKFLRITDIQDGGVDWNTVPWCECSGKAMIAARLQRGDIVFARTGATTGKSYLISECPEEAVFASYLIRVRLSNRAYPGYVSHYFQTSCYWNQISKSARGVAQPGVNASTLKSLPIPLPPLAEQKRIAAILDAADGLRARRRASLAELDTLLQSTFLEMFGDPVTNPMGWEVTTMGQAIKQGVILGLKDGNHGERHPKVADFCEVGVPFVMANCLRDRQIDIRGAYKLPDEWLKWLRVGFARGGDVLLSHKGTIGAVAVVPNDIKVLILSPQVTYYRTSERLSTEFLVEMFATRSYQQFLEKEAKQSTRAYIGITRQLKLPLILPPLDLQRSFAAIVESVKAQKTRLRVHLAELDALFASLQARAFNGEL